MGGTRRPSTLVQVRFVFPFPFPFPFPFSSLDLEVILVEGLERLMNCGFVFCFLSLFLCLLFVFCCFYIFSDKCFLHFLFLKSLNIFFFWLYIHLIQTFFFYLTYKLFSLPFTIFNLTFHHCSFKI